MKVWRGIQGMHQFLSVLVCLMIMISYHGIATADELDQYPFGHFHSDPAPITFNVGGVYYRFPGNYLLDVSQSSDKPLTIASLTAVFPSMQPFNEETKHCYATAPLYRTPDCLILEFFIQPPGAANTSDPIVYERWKNLFHSQNPIATPYNYELYEIGPDNARINTYRKVLGASANILIQCDIDKTIEKYGICSTSFQNKENGIILLRFTSKELDRSTDMIFAVQNFVNDHTLGPKAAP